MKKYFLFSFMLILLHIFILSTLSVAAAETVNVSTVSELQSAHPYSNNMNKTWVYTHPMVTDILEITFSANTETESNYDFIYIFDGYDNQIGQYSGTQLAGKTITIPGNIVKIKLTSDSSVTKNGFTVSTINSSNNCGPVQNLKVKDRDYKSTTLEFPEISDAEEIILEQSVDNNDYVKILNIPASTSNISVELPPNDITYYFRLNVVGGDNEGISNVVSTNYAKEKFVCSFGVVEEYIGNDEIVVVPPTIHGTPVSKIKAYTFENCDNLKSLTLPFVGISENHSSYYLRVFGAIFGHFTTKDYRETFGTNQYWQPAVGGGIYYRYYIPDSIEEVTLTSCTSIPEGAFKNCKNLKSVTIPKDVERIYESAFAGCTNLETLYFNAADCTYVDENIGVYGSSNGVHIIFGDDVQRIPRDIVSPYTNKITLGQNIKEISAYVFDDTQYYKNESNWENGMLYIDNWLIDVKEDYSGEYKIKEGTIGIANNAFSNCKSVSSISIPDSVIYIGEGAFCDCTNLSCVIIPNNVTTIPSNAFDGCTNLNYVIIPQSITNISDSAFNNCYKIEWVAYTGNEEQWNAITIDSGNTVLENTTIHNNAYFYNEDADIYLMISDGILLKYWGEKKDLVVPQNIHTIKDKAFSKNNNFDSVFIPKTVSTIGENTFSECSNLKEAVFENGITKTGIGTFVGCSNLQKVMLPDTLIDIENKCFSGCVGIVAVDIPESINTIGDYAFENCRNLNNITIPYNVKSIGNNAFNGCIALKNLTYNAKKCEIYYKEYVNSGKWQRDYSFKNCGHNEGFCVIIGESVQGIPSYFLTDNTKVSEIVFNNGAETIDNYAFSGCYNLTDIEIPTSVTAIGDNAFYKCTGLTNINIPDSITTIGAYAFYNCTGLSNVKTPNSVTIIGDSAFYKCIGLTSIEISDGVTTLGDDVFSYCTNLKSIVIPNTVIENGRRMLYGCDNLEEVTLPFVGSKQGSGESLTYIFGEIPSALSKLTITNETKIPERAFYNYVDLTEIKLNDDIISIGEDAFYNCGYSNVEENWEDEFLYIGNYLIDVKSTVASCNVKDGTTVMADRLFENCTDLLRVVLPDSMINIPQYAFCGCNNLLKLTLTNNISFIGDFAFKGCSNLTKINIPSKVTQIGDSAFKGCSNLQGVYITNMESWCKIEFDIALSNPLYYAHKLYLNDILIETVTIPKSITEINEYAFYGCSNLKSVFIPYGITHINKNAFYQTGLTTLSIPDTLSFVGEDAFEYCYNLEHIYIQDIEKWCNITFENDYSYPLIYDGKLYLNNALIQELSIPETLTSINKNLFSHCTGIKSITVHDAVKYIEENAFYGCSDITCVIIPENIVYIKNNAFSGCSNIKYVFFKGTKAQWDDMLIYAGNDYLQNATIICNAKETIYKFETNNDIIPFEKTAYCIVVPPDIQNEKQLMMGWYDNSLLTGEKITFPYYADEGILYASWIDRTGDYYTPFLLPENKKCDVNVNNSNDYVYYEITPKHTAKYDIYSEGDIDTYATLMSFDRYMLISDDDTGNNGNFSISYFLEAGKTYYLRVNSKDKSGDFLLTIKSAEIRRTETTISENGKIFTVHPINIETGVTVILALYDNKKLVEMQSATYEGNELSFTTNKTYTNTKVMVWDNLTSLKPACDVEIVK